jgi:threonine dehydratase
MLPPQYISMLLRQILTSRVYDVAKETPLDAAPRLSRRLDNRVLLKREDLQPIFSFKIRGAYNRIASLSDDQRARGVVAASAGNHAQGVAFSARRLGMRAVIVMPRTTPEIKVDAVKTLGADVVLIGDHYGEAQRHAEQLAAGSGMTLVHPFDDPLVIAGQGTVAVELLRQAPRDLAAVFVPVGGGGLIAGMGTYIKAMMPDVRVVGVEPVDADAMAQSIAAGHRVRLEAVGMFADGVAVQQVGEHTFRIAQASVSEIIRVTNDEICAAIKDIFDDTRTIVEPAGALALAGLKSYVESRGVQGQALAAVLSGANMNFDRLRFVAERAELGEGREALLAVTIPERAGAFRAFCAALGECVVTEFNYRLSGRDRAEIFVGVATQSRSDGERFVTSLRERGYETTDLSANEMAKLHVRHMVGGRTPHVVAERVCRFEFPERPGALMQFLDALGGRWNISLFHYRNHGADFGRVLAAFEVPPVEGAEFESFLSNLGYQFQLDEHNDAYRRFLGHA